MLDEMAHKAGLIHDYAGSSMIVLICDLPVTVLARPCGNGKHLLARRLEHRFRDSHVRMLLAQVLLQRLRVRQVLFAHDAMLSQVRILLRRGSLDEEFLT